MPAMKDIARSFQSIGENATTLQIRKYNLHIVYASNKTSRRFVSKTILERNILTVGGEDSTLIFRIRFQLRQVYAPIVQTISCRQ